MQVAQTILEQLGGNRFAAMTGATNFLGAADSLTFALPSNFATRGINRVRVTLTAADLYRVEAFKIRGTNVAAIADVDGIYADRLRAEFERLTGLATSL